MSWEATKFVVDLVTTPKGEPLTRAEKYLLLILANHYSPQKGAAWPSVKLLARQALCSRRYVQKLLVSLKRKGAIKITARERKNGSQSSSVYRLCGFKPQRGSEGVEPW